MADSSSIYRITFVNQGEVYEVFARQVNQGGLLGFVEIEELIFGERTKIVIDSSEERIKTEFDEVDKAGRGRIVASGDKVADFPMTYVPHTSGESK